MHDNDNFRYLPLKLFRKVHSLSTRSDVHHSARAWQLDRDRLINGSREQLRSSSITDATLPI
jgi:hypothetical protein